MQGASYFYSAPAKGLLPGASLLVFLPMGSAMQGSTVPAAAIVWWQGRAWVYTQNSADRFVRRELSAGGSIDGGWFVPGGFANGEPVVTAGAQLLLSEELRSQITVSEEDRP